MKIKTIAALVITIFLFPVFLVHAAERCIMCGMDALKSETKFIVQITEGTKEIAPGKYSMCCLHCLVILKAKMKSGKIGSILARDYDTVTEKYDSGKMIDAKNAFYLVESQAHPKGSMVPFMLILSTRETAEKHKWWFGNKTLMLSETLVTIFAFIVFILALHTKISPLFLGLPFHHCVFCLGQEVWDALLFFAMIFIGLTLFIIYFWVVCSKNYRYVNPILSNNMVKLLKWSGFMLAGGLAVLSIHLALAV